jgi:hypothetical protein
MSQSHDPKLDEVKRVLRRIQDLGQHSELAEPDARRERSPSLHQRLAALSPAPNPLGGHNPTLDPLADGMDLQDAKREKPFGGGPRLTNIFLATLAGVSAIGLALFLSAAGIKREVASSRLPEPPASVAMAISTAPQSPPASGLSGKTRREAASDKLAIAHRLVAPPEWSAPAGAATKLPLSVEPQEEARNYQVLVSGLEASAFVVKGTEIISGTWIVPANELAHAMVVRNANAPGRTIVTVELRAESGEIVSQAKSILFAQPLAVETGAATANR